MTGMLAWHMTTGAPHSHCCYTSCTCRAITPHRTPHAKDNTIPNPWRSPPCTSNTRSQHPALPNAHHSGNAHSWSGHYRYSRSNTSAFAHHHSRARHGSGRACTRPAAGTDQDAGGQQWRCMDTCGAWSDECRWQVGGACMHVCLCFAQYAQVHAHIASTRLLPGCFPDQLSQEMPCTFMYTLHTYIK